MIEYDLLIVAALLLCGLVFGTLTEKGHYRSILRREKKLSPIPCSTFEFLPPRPVSRVGVATGSAVIASDRFKDAVGSLVNLFGGEINAYSSMIDRARREAVLRMKESAPWADCFVNVRLETSQIEGHAANSSVFAYATAVSFVEK